jgi:protein TonB
MKRLILASVLMIAGLQLNAQQDMKPPKTEANYTGGSEAMNTYIAKNLKYPAKSTVEGKVYVEFFIDSSGKVTKAKVLKGIDPALDKLALDVVSKMPNWIPAKDDHGKAIESKMVLPINFKK